MKYKFDRNRPLSWSAIYSFEYDKEQWWEKYCKHAKCTREFCAIAGKFTKLCPVIKTTPEMEFGSKIGKKLETNPKFLPQIKRQKIMEYKFEGVFEGIPMIGYGDSFCDEILALEEYKTGVKVWDQKRADEHGQITMYLFLKWLKDRTDPTKVTNRIWWMPTVKTENALFEVTIEFKDPIEDHIKCFTTKRTMHDLMMFAKRIKKTYKEMKLYEKNHD